MREERNFILETASPAVTGVTDVAKPCRGSASINIMEDTFSSRLDGDLHAEMEIIRCCARSSMDEQTRERLVGLLAGPVDWPYLIRAARTHGVMALVYRSLRDEVPEHVSEKILQQLQRLCVHSVAYHTFLTETLLELLRLFAANHVGAVPLKGPILAATAYARPALRAFGDLDIMVRRPDVPKAVELLTNAGYQPFSKSNGTENVSDLVQSRLRKDAGFMRNDGLVCVEIHWDFLPEARSFPLTPEYAWRSCEDVSVAGTTVSSFSTEHMLVFLCAHGAKHAWMRLKWICDVAELVGTHPAMDWERVFDEARRLRSERMVRLGLLLASEMAGARLPPSVQSYVARDVKAQSLAGDVVKRLLVGQEEMERWEESLFWINSRESVRDKIPGVLYYLFRNLVSPTSRDQAFVSLPRRLFFLYYLVRPVRLISERGESADESGQSPDAVTSARPEPEVS